MAKSSSRPPKTPPEKPEIKIVELSEFVRSVLSSLKTGGEVHLFNTKTPMGVGHIEIRANVVAEPIKDGVVRLRLSHDADKIEKVQTVSVRLAPGVKPGIADAMKLDVEFDDASGELIINDKCSGPHGGGGGPDI